MTTGLTQRRRNNGGSTDAFDEVQDPLANRLSTQTSQILDPQSLPHETEDDDDKKGRQLTLMEQVLLLGLKDSQVAPQLAHPQGTLSFWNDNISYVLRGCILMELSFRNKIQIKREHRRKPFQDRVIEVIDASNTGEVLLDEALRYMKDDEDSVCNWIDFLSGETWNLLKIGYQLKQVRERIAKGLVDKGVLRTEKKSFVIFDMATHPLSDSVVKKRLVQKVIDTLLSRGGAPDKKTIALVCAAYAANLLETVLSDVSHAQRESAYIRADELLKEYCNLPESAKNMGMTEVVAGYACLQRLINSVLCVYSKMDSIL